MPLIAAPRRRAAPISRQRNARLRSLTILTSLLFIAAGCAAAIQPGARSPAAGSTVNRAALGAGDPAEARCYVFAGRAVAPVSLTYAVGDYGGGLHTEKSGPARAPRLSTVACRDSGASILENHEFIFSDRYTTTFIGRQPKAPLRTDYQVAVVGDICAATPQLNFFVPQVRSDARGPENAILKNFFVHQLFFGKYSDRFLRVARPQCRARGIDYRPPEAFRIEIYAPPELATLYENGRPKPNPGRLGPFLAVYKGVLFPNNWDATRWRDDDPGPRYDFITREQDYQRRLAETYRRRRAQEAAIYEAMFATAFGFVQQLANEFTDEGICSVVTVAGSGDWAAYKKCHNALYEMQRRLETNSPEAYFVGSLLGMIYKGLQEEARPGESREATAARLAVKACADAMLSEIGRGRVGYRPDGAAMAEACALGGAVGGAQGAASPRN